MNSKELFLSDGKSAGVFYCSECKIVHRDTSLAEQCCRPYLCDTCGKETERYWSRCQSCRDVAEAKKESELFVAAEKVNQWDGFVYLEGHGNDGFADDVHDLFDQAEFSSADEIPNYVWTCDPDSFVCVDVGDILQQIEESEGAYEDFDARECYGIPELEKAIETFNAANEKIIAYRPNYKRALLVDRVEIAKWMKLEVAS